MCVCLRVSTCEIFHNEKPTRKNLIERTQTHTHAYDSFIMHACLCARMHVFVTTRTSTAEQRRWRRRRLRNFPSLCFMLALPAVLLCCDSASLADDASTSSQRLVVVIYRFHRSPTLAATVTSPQNPLAEHLYLRSRCCRLPSPSESFISEREWERGRLLRTCLCVCVCV